MQDNMIDLYGLGTYLSRRVSQLSRGAQTPEYWSGIGNPVLVQR